MLCTIGKILLNYHMFGVLSERFKNWGSTYINLGSFPLCTRNDNFRAFSVKHGPKVLRVKTRILKVVQFHLALLCTTWNLNPASTCTDDIMDNCEEIMKLQHGEQGNYTFLAFERASKVDRNILKVGRLRAGLIVGRTCNK